MNITADSGLLYNISQLFTVRCLFIKKWTTTIYIKYNKT